MKRIAVYPGTFDPVTQGHEAMVLRSLPLFDHIVVAVGHNSAKPQAGYFTLEQRLEMLHKVFDKMPNVSVEAYEGLTTEFCKQKGAHFILRGLRSSTDFEYERNIAQANNALEPSIETVFIISSPGLSAINSSIVRDIHRHGGDVSQFVPEAVIPLL
ncbi:MAG: pantetheine-phosphate adenylyltransferase [Flavobacteriales bacterium]|nr:pantetheine-phosphate adenylyltransferase [Flavobacteriales bacterium]